MTSPSLDLEKVLWEIWKDYCDEMKCDVPFDAVNEVMSDPTANSMISNIKVVDLPANTPPDVAHQIIVQIAQQTPLTTRSSINKSAMIASVESKKLSKAFYNRINLLYWRNPDMSLGINCTVSSSGWIDYENK